MKNKLPDSSAPVQCEHKRSLFPEIKILKETFLKSCSAETI